MPELWPAFDWADPLLLDASLREEERLIQSSARGFAQSRLMPLVQEMHRQESFDRGLLQEMGALGLLGSTLKEFGGVSPVGYGLIAREFERVDSAFRSSLSVQSSLVMHPIRAFGSAAQREKYLPKLASGEWIGSFGLTESSAGSDPGGMQSRARRSKAGFVLSGAKTWITHAPLADILVVWAKLDEKIRGFILERGDKGLTTPKIEGKFSLRASVTGEIAMNDVELPEERMLPEAEGLKAPFACLNHARQGIAW
ncbi:MAG TPA: acyl-CoA dehydrogenase family protein, partial [Rhizomicrobium sp.]|nr:acyl-CoA dehydrogenase family protein [Rhizomicrobium sp.]